MTTLPTVTGTTSPSRLCDVVISSRDLERDTAVFTAITGMQPSCVDEQSPSGTVAFTMGNGRVTLISGPLPAGSTERGITRIIIDVDDLTARTRALEQDGAKLHRTADQVEVDRTWAGTTVELRNATPSNATPSNDTASNDTASGAGGAVLDHVAILVGDLESMTRRWTTILGTPPANVGLHPLGTSIAARFILGDRMIELLAGLPDRESPLRARHHQVGDSPFALALISTDLDATILNITATGSRILNQPPHLVIHPSDAGGVPIQITPRVHH